MEKAIHARRSEARPSLQSALLCDAAAAALDRGDVRGARRLLEAGPMGDPASRAAGLLRWSRLLSPTPPGELRPGPPCGPLPRPLVELRQERSELLALLAGPPSTRPGSDLSPSPSPLRRRDRVGASVLAWFRLGGEGRPLLLDLAPALTDRVAAWRAGRDGAWRVPGEGEHRLLLTAAPVVQRSGPGEPAPRGCLDRDARALALVPVLDGRGDVAGWLHLEFEHWLVPSRARLLALAAGTRDALLEPPPPTREAPPSNPGADRDPVDPADWEPLVRTFTSLVTRLAIKTSHRRWWGFAVERGRPIPVTGGGSGLGDEGLGSGGLGNGDVGQGPGGRALQRALAAGGVAGFDAPDPHLSIHPRAGSGVVLPARVGGQVTALLVLESERRRDFRERDVARLSAAVDAAALDLRTALFRSWHRRRFGADLHLDGGRAGFAHFARRLVAAGRSATPVVLQGPAGGGKRTLARWLHFETLQGEADGDRPGDGIVAGDDPDRFRSFTPGVGGNLGDGHLEGPGTLVVVDPQDLDRRDQRLLLRALERGPRRGMGRRKGARRIVATLTRTLAETLEDGSLDLELATRLQRMELRVPPLRDRRDEVPGLVRLLIRRFATEERLVPPRPDDGALGLLWRQDWPGNLPELENAVYKLVLARPGESLDADGVRGVLEPFGLELAPRLPSRHPRRTDVLAALAVTRRETGRLNKTRAAMYLGWDPDTLVARMGDLSVDATSLEDPRGWSAP